MELYLEITIQEQIADLALDQVAAAEVEEQSLYLRLLANLSRNLIKIKELDLEGQMATLVLDLVVRIAIKELD
ncbi:uncharacterized protein VTP21DRAFT_9045 [Calcarisporiella thermophila]|uniref:uncharacterized protein n=1 Tax=Calcarisporiella thermophila TaxID=911321 RepID=UPI003743D80C